MIRARRFNVVAAVTIVASLMLGSPAAAGQMTASSIASPGHDTLSPELQALASRLNVAPFELSAIADQGTLPGAWAQFLQDAYAAGVDVATSTGLDAPHAAIVGGQFACYLTRIEREARSRGTATFNDVMATVRHDVRETLRLNLGEDLATAADARLASLTPLQVH